jgi:lipopolysaccharide/colanic/teichoic acid biosynthesis glycosyltransferase
MLLVLAPILSAFAVCLLVVDGRPVFYVSRRRTDQGPAREIVKFRTMRRDADKIANRSTVPINGTCFLNLPPDSPLYTPIGRFIERTMMTEMPQLLQVLQGRLSIVGNRPLPDDVVLSLRRAYPETEKRFLVRCGLTGPVQLVGRDNLSDAARLEIEIAYCEAVLRSYSFTLDLLILYYTVASGLGLRFRLTPEGALRLIQRHSSPSVSVLASRFPESSAQRVGGRSVRDRKETVIHRGGAP